MDIKDFPDTKATSLSPREQPSSTVPNKRPLRADERRIGVPTKNQSKWYRAEDAEVVTTRYFNMFEEGTISVCWELGCRTSDNVIKREDFERTIMQSPDFRNSL